MDAIFQSILVRCCARNLMSESRKIIKFDWKNRHFLLLGCFNIRSFLDTIFVSNLLHFGAKKSPKSRLGGVLGRLVGVLSRLGSILRRLGAVLGRLGVVLGRLGSVLQAPERETMNFQ